MTFTLPVFIFLLASLLEMDLFGLLALKGDSSKYARVIPFGSLYQKDSLQTPLILMQNLYLTGFAMSLLPRLRDILYLEVHFPLSNKFLSLF